MTAPVMGPLDHVSAGDVVAVAGGLLLVVQAVVRGRRARQAHDRAQVARICQRAAHLDRAPASTTEEP